MLFTFTLSNAESRGGRMNLKVLANVRRGWTDCRAATLTFFLCLREEGEDSERGETKFSAGVTVKFTAPTTMHVEEKQPECSQRHSKCEQEHEEAGSFRLNAHRTVQTRPVWSSVHDGIFPDDYFYTRPLGRPHERRLMASRREQVSALFFEAWTQRPLTDSFPWATEGANPLKETPTFKKRIFWRPAPGSLPAGLKLSFRHSVERLRIFLSPHLKKKKNEHCNKGSATERAWTENPSLKNPESIHLSHLRLDESRWKENTKIRTSAQVAGGGPRPGGLALRKR